MRDWATTFDAVEGGEAGVASDVLGKILGREPKSMKVYLAESLGEHVTEPNVL